ncbi:MAG TPA: MFS transporter [Nocardioidaceae bacterium]|nr:MFS transporter [Nocardioidaceae bacterium]
MLARLGHLSRGRRFRQLLAVRLVSQCADGVFQAALAAYVLFSPEDKPTVAAVAAALAALLIPYSVLGPFVGVFLDRWRRRQVLLFANVVRVAPVLAAAALVLAGHTGMVLFIVVLAALSVNRFFLAALSAALPHVVEDDDLVTANALTPTAGTVSTMIGAGLASVALVRLPSAHPAAVVVAASAAVYLLAAALATRMPPELLGPETGARPAKLSDALAVVARGLGAGLRHLGQRRGPAGALLVVTGHRFLYGLATVATVVLYRNYFNTPEQTTSAFEGVIGVVLVSGLGYFLAAVLTPLATARLAKESWVALLLTAAAVVVVFPGTLFTQVATLVAALVLGISAQGVKICVDTIVQTGVDDEFRGRVFSVYDMAYNAVFVAAAAAGILVIPADGRSYGLLVAIGVLYAVLASVYARATHRRPAVEQPTGASV